MKTMAGLNFIPPIPALRRLLVGIAVSSGAIVTAGDPTAAGDVIGRDLNILGYETLGHLGIFTGSRVLECLNEKNPIQQNSLASFKAVTTYWGARYITGRHDFNKVIATGWAQRNFKPSFTLSPVYTVGHHVNKRVWNPEVRRWETRTVLVPAKFRCDTFVYHSFKAGIGYELAAGQITPRIVYRNCAKSR